ncbi:hypothetical protein CY0110_18242 [Crocosphaera chwakensis CCY0110]|uniref:Uncharacterized protein n=1 Tax=Crocosphaera chwakensis CCY0110 TaxID=391612 RepID=A3IIY0_9CHRO|nr:hypothetical protein CY0110_18242 [Crocosphaera chwakensis CCY0110]
MTNHCGTVKGFRRSNTGNNCIKTF